jgi:uncharacterized Fe-S cluster-containing radical SAM superfamily protein
MTTKGKVSSEGGLDPDRLASVLRERVIRVSQKQILLARFYGTQQEQDVTSGINCNGYGRLHRYNRPSQRWISEPIPEEPAAWRLGLDPSRTRSAQLFQNAACDFRCWYCFVDRASLSGTSEDARFMTTDEMLELYISEGIPSPVIVLTGGQPDITPEWTVWMMQSLEKFGLSDNTYLWQDDNLSCGYTWTHLSPQDRDLIRFYRNYGRCCCLKSFTPEGFAETTRAKPRFFDRQFELLGKLVVWGVDVYVYLTLTTSSLNNLSQEMSRFMDRLQSEIHPNIPLRVVPLEIKEYTPTLGRLTAERRSALENQYCALQAWQEELYKRFSSEDLSRPIYDVPINRE